MTTSSATTVGAERYTEERMTWGPGARRGAENAVDDDGEEGDGYEEPVFTLGSGEAVDKIGLL
ncbi:hypothetical protein MMC17_005119 [Xylographa soralifera]|nr:hypothetical protein [Xylographa soralifera]